MRDTSGLGRKAEELAEAYLTSLGWKIVERNFSCKVGELDLIAREGEDLVFVEVRSRADSRHGAPAETIGPAKIRRLVNTAKVYIILKQLDCRMRFDVIAIEAGRLEHIPAAFEAGR